MAGLRVRAQLFSERFTVPTAFVLEPQEVGDVRPNMEQKAAGLGDAPQGLIAGAAQMDAELAGRVGVAE